MALDYDLVVAAGKRFVRSFPVLDDDTGQPVSLDGWTARGQIRERATSPTVLHDLDPTPNGVNIEIAIPAAVSATWAWQAARYDIELLPPDGGDPIDFARGHVYVQPEVTRS